MFSISYDCNKSCYFSQKDLEYMHACILSHFSQVQLFATLWTIDHKAPLSMEFSTQEYQSRLPCPPPGKNPNPETESVSSVLQAESLHTWEALRIHVIIFLFFLHALLSEKSHFCSYLDFLNISIWNLLLNISVIYSVKIQEKKHYCLEG